MTGIGLAAGRAPFGKAFLGVADQVIYSIGNMLFYVVVARQTDSRTFGVVAMGALLYESSQLALRGTFAQPALLLIPSVPDVKARRLASGQLTFSLLLGLVCAVAVAGMELVLVKDAGDLRLLLWLAVASAPMFFQEAVRSACFALQRVGVALLSDIVWTGIQAVGSVVLLATGRASAVALIALWGAGAAVGALIGLARLHLTPNLAAIGGWIDAVKPLVRNLTLENLLSMFQTHAVSWIVLVVVGPIGVGAIRLIRTVFGPVNSLMAGLRQAMLPVLRQNIGHNNGLVRVAAGGLGGLVVISATAIGLTVAVIPTDLGTQALGSTFALAQELVVVQMLFVGGTGVLVASQVVLLASLRTGQLVWLRAALATSSLLATAIGATVGGTLGAIAGAALALYLVLPAWLSAAKRALQGSEETVDTIPHSAPSMDA